jgi:type II secretory ATPase GspE/PulE/Tfp pilus assembly ATPase PilB-like protein
MDISSEKEKNNVDAKIPAAETIISQRRDNISQVLNSGHALKELGLYEEALNEYQKLFSLEYPKIKILIIILACLIKFHSHEKVIQKIQEMMDIHGIKGREKDQMNHMLGFEMKKYGYEELAQDLLTLANHKENQGKTTGSKYDYLIKEKLVNLEQLQTALALSKKQKKSVEQVLIEKFKIDKEQVGKSLSKYSGCKFKSFDPDFPVPYDLISNLKQSFLLNELWIPLKWDKNFVEIIIDDPKNLIKTDRIRNLVKTKQLIFSVGTKEDIEAYINHFFENKKREDSAASMIFNDTFEMSPDIEPEKEYRTSVRENLVDESSGQIVHFVDQVIITAYRDKISDIHIEPSSVTQKTLIRFRRDGVCQEYISVPNTMARAILSRIKIMSNLDIAERRLPQDGKIKFRRKGVPEFELRVATLPTTGGFEDAVLRILAKAGAMPLEEMGMTDRNLAILKKIIVQPYGLILVVGPTGSGKTTTLHAALGYINKPSIKIWTAEDPVEITQAGLRQVEVKPKIGLDFARVMRAFLRADPDVIMIGEMRDYETASTGIEASLTGHLVLSTLHTNSAPETITRLLDMGLNALNFSDAFRGVLAQRLVRKLCKNCREPYHPSEEEFNEIIEQFGRDSLNKGDIKYNADLNLYKPKGCEKCNQSGYRGRMGIHEMMEGTPLIKKMIKKQSPTDELFRQAAKEGMYTLEQDGILKVLQGFTDMNEVRRVCID